MPLIGKIICFLMFGLEMGLAWVVIGLAFCCAIIGIPFGIACFRLAKVSFAPLGKKVVNN